jgi:hypothetical protein
MSDRSDHRPARPAVAGIDEASIPVLTERLTLPADQDGDAGKRLPRPPEPEVTLPEPPDLDFRLPAELLMPPAAQPAGASAPALPERIDPPGFAAAASAVVQRLEAALSATLPELPAGAAAPELLPAEAEAGVGAALDDPPAPPTTAPSAITGRPAEPSAGADAVATVALATAWPTPMLPAAAAPAAARAAIEPASAQPAIPNFLTKAAAAAQPPAPPVIDASPHWARIEIELRESVLLALSERLPTDVERIVRERMSAGIEAMITRLENDVRRAVAATLREIVERAVHAEFERLRAAKR